MRKIKTKIIIVVVAIILVTTTVFVTKYLTEKNNTTSVAIGKADIEIVNDTIKKVIDAYVSELQLKRDHYVIGLQLQRIEDTLNVQIGPSYFELGWIYKFPTFGYASYDNKYLLIENGFEKCFSFNNDNQDKIAKLCFSEQFKKYKKTGKLPNPILPEGSFWVVKIRQNKIISINKHSQFDPIYWDRY